MRVKDDEKRRALIGATVKLVNEIGFAATSVSKIAKEAGVSPSTLYIYFENKEDLLVSTYVDIKLDLSQAMLEGFDPGRPIRDTIEQVWRNTFDFVSSHRTAYAFTEQFASSPYSELVDQDAIHKHFEPIIAVIAQGIEQKILKNVSLDLMAAFIFHPISWLANPRLCHGNVPEGTEIETAFTMAWDAIKL